MNAHHLPAPILYLAAGGFSIGIFVRSFYELHPAVVAWLLVITLGVAWVWRIKHQSEYAVIALLTSIVLLAGALGVLRMEVASWGEVVALYEGSLSQEIMLTGTVVREPDVRERATHLYVDTEHDLVLVTVDRFTDISYGDVITAVGRLETPEPFTTDLGRTFNYPGYLKARGVTYVLPYAEVDVIASGHGNLFISTLLHAKHQFMIALEAVMREPAVGLGEGLLLGVKRALGPDLEEAFRVTGIIHIVVLSGYNVALVVVFVQYILRRFLSRTLQVVCGVCAIASFALLVGLSATVVRASLMAAILLLLSLTGRVYLVVRALVVAGVVMLIINPYLLAFDVGFQLSFVATLGLIVLAPVIIDKSNWLPSWFGIREFFAATVATQIFVAPILLYQIGQFSLVSVVVNVLVLPMVPLAMLATFVTGLIAQVSLSAALYFSTITELTLRYIIEVAEWFAAVPYAAVVVPALPFWLVPLSYGIGGALLWWLSIRNTKESIPTLRHWTIVSEDSLKSATRP